MVSTEVAIPAGIRTRDWPRAQQCGRTKEDGARCRRRALRGGRVCYVHGGQLPSVRAAAEAEVTELRTRALSIADRALDVVEDALEDKDPNVRLRASAQLLAAGVPVADVSKLAGHADIRTTVNTYGHIQADNRLAAALLLAARLDG